MHGVNMTWMLASVSKWDLSKEGSVSPHQTISLYGCLEEAQDSQFKEEAWV